MKDVKASLKEARDAIKNKNFEAALKLSKSILRDDKTNYMALVFMGVSMQELGTADQALNAFKKAIQINSDNPLAWNGLVGFYEKRDDPQSKNELNKTCLKLLELETNDKKLIELCGKLNKNGEFGDLEEIAGKIYDLIKNGKTGDKVSEVWVELESLLSNNKQISPNLQQMYEESLNFLVNSQKTVSRDYYNKYLSLLQKSKNNDKLLKVAEKMNSLFETDSISLNWICKLFNEKYVETGDYLKTKEEIEQFCNKLFILEPKSAMGLFTKSILLISEDKLTEAVEQLEGVVKLRPGLLHVWVLLSDCYVKLFLYPEAIQAALRGDKLLQSINNSNKNLRSKLDCLLIDSLSRSPEKEDLEKVLELFEKCNDDVKKICKVSLIRAHINLHNYETARDLIKGTSNDKNCILLEAELLHRENKLQDALELLQKDEPTDYEHWLEIALIYNDLGQIDKCLVPLLKAAKLQTNNFKCFLNLGHYYKKTGDFDKARRCYEKAFKLNPRCSEAGFELSKTYIKLKQWDSNLNLLQNLTKGLINRNNSWAWLQLGLNYIEQENYVEAINQFRLVIRVDPTNTHCWESLADAYLARGAYTSALKCYERAVELGGHALYPSLQVANIKKILGEFAEARADFDNILATNKTYVPALKGLAETCFYQALQCKKDQRLGTARDNAQAAVDKLTLALQQRSDFSCLWKILGDCCLFVARLPKKYNRLLISSPLIESEKNLEQLDSFELAAKCYCKSLSLISDNNVLLWHDLATCYLHHALNTDENRKEILEKASAAALHCISLDPNGSQYWNLLGNVAFNEEPANYALAQHCFIKAVDADNNNAIAWCNLGALYLLVNEFKLANEAFSQAQRSDPNYACSWIGQALLAESVGHEEAMDLFRHSTQLAAHQQGTLGYGHWVCKTLLNSPPGAVIYSIHNMHAIPIAMDALTWYTDREPDDSAAWNMLGILQERMGLQKSARESFKRALDLAANEFRDKAKVNYGRLLAKLEQLADAISVFSSVEEASFKSGSGLALALFKNGQYEESYEAYEAALHWLADEQTSQSDLLVALASIAYMFQGMEAAKTLLFQSIQLKNPSPWAFYATLSLALLHNDQTLTKLVLIELQQFKNEKLSFSHYATLMAYTSMVQGEQRLALLGVKKFIHQYPDEAKVWFLLATLLVMLSECEGKSATICANTAMKLGQTTNMDLEKVLCLVSLATFLAGDLKQATKMAEKSIHCYPNAAEGWAMLITILSGDETKNYYVKSVISKFDCFNPSPVLQKWAKHVTQLIK